MKFKAATLAVLSSVILHTAAYANDGFYVGALVGYNSTDIEYEDNIVPLKSEFSATGGEFGIFAGYEKNLENKLFVAGEVEYVLSGAENELVSGGESLKTSKDNSYGVSARLGYDMGQVRPYVKLGYVRAEFEQELSGTINAKDDESKTGFAYGVGADIAVNDRWAVRGEFTQVAYDEIEVVDGANRVTYDPTESSARIGLSYKF